MNIMGQEAEKYKVDLVGLQEILWRGQGSIRKSKFILYYSGDVKTGLSRSMFQCLKQSKQVSTRIFTHL